MIDNPTPEDLVFKALTHAQNPNAAQVMLIKLMIHAKWQHLYDAVRYIEELGLVDKQPYMRAWRPEDPEAVAAMLECLTISNEP